MKIIVMVASAIICYLLGSISSSILVGRMFGLSDIRKHGSGNAGATNTLRVLGKKAAVFTDFCVYFRFCNCTRSQFPDIF